MKKTRVVMLELWPIANSQGGLERVFCSMGNALTARGYEVVAVTFDQGEGKPAYPVDERVRFVKVGCRRPLYCYPPLRDILCYARSREERHRARGRQLMHWQASVLRSVLEEFENADIVISYQCAGAYILRECLGFKGTLVTMMHSYPPVYTDRPVFDVMRDAVSSSTCVQVLMPRFVEVARSRLSGNPDIRYIPNIVQPVEESPDYDSRIICSVGRLSEEKSVELLVEAFALVKDKFPDWKVHWWGGQGRWWYVRKIREAIRHHRLEDRFVMCGATDNVNAELLRSSMFAFPSRFEGFGLALAEAMAAGLPVIGLKNCPAINDHIRDGVDGYLVESSAEALAEALERLMFDRELRARLGSNAKTRVAEYSEDAVWGTWSRLIDELTGKPA